MRDKEIKILWGRSGNRCSICKIELTPDGSRETLGEMAHIVGHSPDGPRGAVELGNHELDSYVNLILLCPTHHVDVDKNPALWPVERLRSIKTEHEKWVSERLDSGQIAVQLVDNSAKMMAEAVEILKPYPNLELIWASPRELLNIFQADAIGCHIIYL